MMVTMETNAFYDWGRWVADCTNCLSAMRVTPGDTTMRCPAPPTGCGAVSQIIWPEDPDRIVRALASHPEHMRHWKPAHE